MKTTLFRGQRIDTKEWVEGSLICDFSNKCWIVESTKHIDTSDIDLGGLFLEVIPKNVGQFTGMIDKNKNKLFDKQWIKIKTSISQEYGKDILFEATKQIVWYENNEICLESKEEQEHIKSGSNHYKYASSDRENIYFLNSLASYEIEIVDNADLVSF